MRRALSTWLVLFFALGPLTTVLQANDDDARLPACCRRNGAHHCAISAEMAKVLARMMAGDSTPGFAAPATCPSYPGSLALLPAPDHALAAIPTSLEVPPVRAEEIFSAESVASNSFLSVHRDRGPPSSLLS